MHVLHEDKVFPAKRSVIVADRGYGDTELWNDWDSNGHTFVVRFKGNIQYKRVAQRDQPDEGEQNILIDEIIQLTGEKTCVDGCGHNAFALTFFLDVINAMV